MKKRNFIFFIVILANILFVKGCKTSPIIYDSNYKLIDNEIKIIIEMINSKNFTEAEKRIKINKEKTKNIDYLDNLEALIYIKKNNFEEALSILKKIEEKNRLTPLSYGIYSMFYRKQNNYEKALEYCNNGIKKYSDIALLWYEKGLNEYFLFQYEKSIISFNRVIFLDNSYSDSFLFRLLSKLYLNKKIDQTLMKDWENIIKKNDIKNYYYIYFCKALYELNFLNEAFQIINEGIKKFPEDKIILNAYIYTYIKTQKREDIEKNRDRLLILSDELLKSIMNPDTIDTYLEVLYSLNEKEKYNEKLNEFRIYFPFDSKILNRKEIK